jgi:hypothetical protein
LLNKHWSISYSRFEDWNQIWCCSLELFSCVRKILLDKLNAWINSIISLNRIRKIDWLSSLDQARDRICLDKYRRSGVSKVLRKKQFSLVKIIHPIKRRKRTTHSTLVIYNWDKWWEWTSYSKIWYWRSYFNIWKWFLAK